MHFELIFGRGAPVTITAISAVVSSEPEKWKLINGDEHGRAFLIRPNTSSRRLRLKSQKQKWRVRMSWRVGPAVWID